MKNEKLKKRKKNQDNQYDSPKEKNDGENKSRWE